MKRPYLTPRQRAIIRLLASGCRIQQIADTVYVEYSTVKDDLRLARELADCHTNEQLTAWWARLHTSGGHKRAQELLDRIDAALTTLERHKSHLDAAIHQRLLSDLSGGHPDDPRHDIPDPLDNVWGAA